ncbi:hypothetical protein [Bifidobacterium catulorum]|uniref:hypothetical protein n=1 Tax=Bifidobacterium catulorum TaxID=1630173 RepID=UPI0011B1F5C1|nr:hypothetical protein [Bifidobacterium catulorum]
MKTKPTPVWQSDSIGVTRNGIPGTSGKTFAVTWPKPFKGTPVVVVNPKDSWLMASVSDVTATGCILSLRNYSSSSKPSEEMRQEVYAYGEIA